MEHSPNLVRLKHGQWHSSDDDPWFKIPGPFQPGRYRLKFVGNVGDDAPRTEMKVYSADDNGQFSEASAIVLGEMPRDAVRRNVRLTIELSKPTMCLRFDPQQATGKFQLSKLRIRPLKRTPAWLKKLKSSLGIYRLRAYLASTREETNLPVGTEAGSVAEMRPQVVMDSVPNVVPLNLQVQPAEPRLNVLIPGMAMRAMSGGPNTAINLTYRMAQAGVPVRYISTCVDMDQDQEPLWNHFQSLTGIRRRLPNVEIVSAFDRNRATVVGSDDVFFGTAWWTVQMIKHALPMMRNRKFLYLIQEFEPGIYNWSSLYALALETYDLDFRGIFCSRLLADYFDQQRIGRFEDPEFMQNSCTWFEPALDESKFYPDPKAHPAKKRLLFYARPNAPRNLFELGLVALKRAVERGAFPAEQWELLFMGEKIQPRDLGCGVTIRPHPWLNYEDYAHLLRGADVGLSLMLSPHTSYPPLEMAACGATVVTNIFSVKTAERLRRISSNLLPVKPNVDAIVAGLLTASERADDFSGRAERPIAEVPRSWDDTFRQVLPAVIQMWNECQGIVSETPSASGDRLERIFAARDIPLKAKAY